MFLVFAVCSNIHVLNALDNNFHDVNSRKKPYSQTFDVPYLRTAHPNNNKKKTTIITICYIKGQRHESLNPVCVDWIQNNRHVNITANLSVLADHMQLFMSSVKSYNSSFRPDNTPSCLVSSQTSSLDTTLSSGSRNGLVSPQKKVKHAWRNTAGNPTQYYYICLESGQ